MRKRITAMAVAGALVAITLAAAPASAASYCGSTCDGKDPASYLVPGPGGPSNYYHCADDAQTVEYLAGDNSHPYIELRYSPQCATAWARTSTITGYVIQVRSYYGNGTWRRTESSSTSNGDSWTPMVNDQALYAEACVSVPYGTWACTWEY